MHAAIPCVLEQGRPIVSSSPNDGQIGLVGRTEAKNGGGCCQRIRRDDGGRSGMDNNAGAIRERLA